MLALPTCLDAEPAEARLAELTVGAVVNNNPPYNRSHHSKSSNCSLTTIKCQGVHVA